MLVLCDTMARTSQFPQVEGEVGIEMSAGDPSLAKCPARLLAQVPSQKLVIASTLPLQGMLCKGRDSGHSLPAVALL